MLRASKTQYIGVDLNYPITPANRGRVETRALRNRVLLNEKPLPSFSAACS
jgi:hypothetical protein